MSDGLRVRAVAVVLALFSLGLVYTTYFYFWPGAAGVLPELLLWLFILGTLGGLLWAAWRWATTVRALDSARRATTTVMLAGLLLAVSSYFGESAWCIQFANTTGAEPWRHPEFAVRTAAGPLGVNVPTFVLGSTVKGFCPKLLPLPHFVGGVLLVAAAAVADRHLRT